MGRGHKACNEREGRHVYGMTFARSGGKHRQKWRQVGMPIGHNTEEGHDAVLCTLQRLQL